MTVAPVFKILPTTQQYDWGKIGSYSTVAQFAAASKIPGFTLEHNKPYAELWMGTHTTSPSKLLSDSKQTLSAYLAEHPELIGKKVVDQFADGCAPDGNIPFLLKVLAIEKALSIQTHPDKKMAERLHAEKPNVYRDANHKPEMAIALTPFSALCGFLPLNQIAAYLKSTPEFASLIPDTIVQNFLEVAKTSASCGPSEKAALKDLFSAVMTAEESGFKAKLAALIARYGSDGESEDERSIKSLVWRLNAQFPGDIGVFCAYMLNHVLLNPGEAIFLAAGEPHAYLTGDIIECMATSDNVIRAGLTPKLRDVPNLVAGLTYEAAQCDKHYVNPAPFASSEHTTLYDPPIPEFSVLQVLLKPGETESHRAIEGPSITIVTEGSGVVTWQWDDTIERLEVSKGEVFFAGAGNAIGFEADDKKGLSVYRAFVETS